MKKIYNLQFTIYNFLLYIFISLYLYILSPTAAFAQTRPFRPAAPGQTPEVVTAPGQTTPDVATLKGLEAIFYNAVAVVLALAGIVLFIMLIIGGFKYMSAGADQQKTQSSRQTLTYAIIGLVVIVSAFLILKLIETLTGVPVTIFKVTN